MTEPVIIDCTANTWIKVASSVTAGTIFKLTQKREIYLQTWRIAGNTAPTTIVEGVDMFEEYDFVVIDSQYPIDVYVRCIDLNGKIRVDL